MSFLFSLLIASTPVTATAIDPEAQAHAMKEAMMMADIGEARHLLGAAPGARFTGVGVGYSDKPKTCLPWEFKNPARTVIADAIIKGDDGRNYRSRHWK